MIATERPLTNCEISILQAVANGLSNKEIARVFRIDRNTVKNELARIAQVLGTDSRTAAVVLAWRRGWIR